MRVLVAVDGFGGTLTARQAGDAIAEGWRRERPDDMVEVLALSDGGEGLLDALGDTAGREVDVEVVGPLGHPVDAHLRMGGTTAVVESALACGLALLEPHLRDPRRTTTWGVGQLVETARAAGARRVLVGLGGSATIDGGAGALCGLGFRLVERDGSGLKVGGGHVGGVAAASRGWSAAFDDVEVRLLADVTTTLMDAPRVFGPQKGADADSVLELEQALERFADVVERDLAGGRDVRTQPGSGAAGGLGFGLACGIGGVLVRGLDEVAGLVGLDAAVAAADLVVTGEGRLDATSFDGKVVGEVVARARVRGRGVQAVVGSVGSDQAWAARLDDLEVASPGGPGQDPAGDVRMAAARLAERTGT